MLFFLQWSVLVLTTSAQTTTDVSTTDSATTPDVSTADASTTDASTTDASTTDAGSSTTDVSTTDALSSTTDVFTTDISTTDFVDWDYQGTDGSFAQSDAIEFYDDTSFDFETMECSFDLDEDYGLLDTSYIMTKHVMLETGSFLVAKDSVYQQLPENCRMFPALKIWKTELNLVGSTMIKLYVLEALFTEYLTDLDVDLSDIALTELSPQLFDNVLENETEQDSFTIDSETIDSPCTDIDDAECASQYNDSFSFGDIPNGRRRTLSNSVSVTLGVNPEKKVQIDAAKAGIHFELNSGIDFSASVSVNFKCKFTKKTFSSFQVTLKASARFEAYMNLLIEGALSFKFQIINVKKRFTFFIGFIPVSVVVYGNLFAGYKSTNVPLSVSFSSGYEEISYEWGYKYSTKEGWSPIQQFSEVEFFRKFSGSINDDKQCFWVEITPSIEFRMGLIFYEFVDVFLSMPFTATTDLKLPGTCNDIASCDQAVNQLTIEPSFDLDVYVGLELKKSAFFDAYLPDPIFVYSKSYDDIAGVCQDFADLVVMDAELCCNLQRSVPETTYVLEDQKDTAVGKFKTAQYYCICLLCVMIYFHFL